MKKDFSRFEETTGITFRDKNLLRQAFTHRSYINEHPHEALNHNERLEYLGDAVLELVVSDHLYRHFLDKPEGELTALRAALVNTNSISAVAHALGVNTFLLLSHGEAKSTGKARQYILANTFEALVGAMYLDQGYDTARDFIRRFLLPSLGEIIEKKLWLDSKSYFQERAQESAGVTPTYEVLEERGPDHDKIFTVGVFLEKDMVARGTGHSKQEAEQAAAEAGLQSKGWM